MAGLEADRRRPAVGKPRNTLKLTPREVLSTGGGRDGAE